MEEVINSKPKKVKEINGKKILYKYGPGCWFTILLSLAVIAIPVLMMFVFPFFTFTSGSNTINVNGMHTLLQLFQREPAEIKAFLAYASNVTQWQWLAEAPGTYIIVAMAAVLAISLVFALTLAIITICFLLGGKLSHRKGPFTMSIWIFVMVLLYCAFPITMLVIEATKGVENAFMHYLYDIIAVGASLIIMILLYVVYAVCMKDRLFFRNAEEIEEYKKKLAEKRSAFPGQIPYVTNGAPASNVPPVQIIINTVEGSKAESVEENEVTITKSSKEKAKDEKKEEPVKPAPAPQPQVQQFIIQSPTPQERNGVVKANIDIPRSTDNIGGHAFAKNTTLQIATIPSGIKELGIGAFANCINLRTVTIPISVTKIGYNCFFNCAKLERINYQGTKKDWSKVVRGSNWLLNAGTTFVNCRDAKLSVDPLK